MEDPAKRTRALNSELANGRLAIGVIMRIMFQNGNFGTTGLEMWLSGSAFERAGRAGSSQLLGPDRLLQGWRRR
eukprot:10175669-Heterocapsa_arctica.AAC.2